MTSIIFCLSFLSFCVCLTISEASRLLSEDLVFYKHSMAKSNLKNCFDGGAYCCDGYVEHPYNASRCIPVCDDKCVNGYCEEPNKCRCYETHFVEDFRGRCVEKCHKDKCECDEGFALSKDLKICEPICKLPCGSNARCIAPDKCECLPGYELTAERCAPVCEKPCYNGICSAPNKCSCFPGYHLKDNYCQAQCWQDCMNGVCARRNECHCKQGHVLRLPDLTCIPLCKGCEKGFCAAPQTCVCPEGYAFDKEGCRPICKGGCINGECTSPGLCICGRGYSLALKSGVCRKFRCAPSKSCETPNY